ncbi:PAS domain S-box protein [Paraburkholderia susongensis]|uniref:Virulence sensor protein BvgS n=1 Tax=Paraburkholderia susongensis TaxID=1515439 RepID=A0A1X7M2Z3_9BURK|nr:PAS domain S-box protein [Paraburkholderia susongensis]SMG60431.1 PAS/PAC sensor hybrid histidine kinase [Paraburkholderia susongensis]
MAPARILIVEDDRVVARDIAQQLMRCGHTVAGSVASGEEAIAVAARAPLDLVLMDVRLEGELDGIDTARRLRETYSLPIVFLTAYADEETVRRATVTEPFGYVLKPFEDQQLRTVVEMALYKHGAERRLRESEQRYAVTLASIGDGVIATDCESRITLINPVAEALTGWSREEAAGQPLAKILVLIDEDTNTPLGDMGTAVLRNRAPVDLPAKTRLVGRHGREVPVETRGTPIVDDVGQVVGVVLAIRDVTETRRAAQAEILRETNERVGAAMRGSNVGVWELELSGENERDWVLRCWNVREWLGYGEHAGAPSFGRFMEIVHPDDRIRFGETFRSQCRGGGALEIEHRLLHRDGSYRWVLTRGTPRGQSGVASARLSGTLIDITELKRAEQALRASEERFRGTFENAAVGIAHCGSDGRFLRVNQRYCEIVGYTRDALLKMTFRDVTDESYLPASVSRFGLLFEKKIPHYAEDKLLVRGDGTRVWVNVCVAMQWEPGERIYHTIAVLQDISERKTLEATVRIARDEAEAANKAKDQFLANISHELRTPLNGILGYAQILRRDDGLNPRQKSHVSVIEQSGTHLLTLINDLLEFARMGAGRIELQPGDVLLAPFLEMLAEMVGVRAREKGLTQTCVIASCMPGVIRVDEKRLRQVLLNLLSNAVKFTDEGEVTFAVGQVSPGMLRFEVRDTGVGITADQIERVFRPFEQAGDTERRSAGVGLGLSISQHLVRLMGSEIHVESEHGRGSRFWFDLAVPDQGERAQAADDADCTRREDIDSVAVEPSAPFDGHCPDMPSGVVSSFGDGERALDASMPFSSAPGDPGTPALLAVPSQENMEILHRLALRGQMRDVIRHADSVLESDERYQAFVRRVRRLAENFESRELLVFIERHMNGREPA